MSAMDSSYLLWASRRQSASSFAPPSERVHFARFPAGLRVLTLLLASRSLIFSFLSFTFRVCSHVLCDVIRSLFVAYQAYTTHSCILYNEKDIVALLMDTRGDAAAQMVEALRYKPEGSGFGSQGGHWDFSLAKSFRLHYGPGVDSSSNREEYQEYLLRGKDVRCVFTTFMCRCLGIRGASPPAALKACPGL